MKYLIFGTLAFLLFLSQTTLAQKWEELSQTEADDDGQSEIFSELYWVAIGYVVQKGKFESTKAPLTGDSYKPDVNSTTYERRNTSTVTYYRFNFTLNEDHGPSTVDATVTISYNPSNSNFIVKNYNYKVDSDGNEGQNGEETEQDSLYSSAYIDTRTVTEDENLASVVSQLFDAIIDYNIQVKSIPDAEYEIQYVYRAYMEEFEGEEEENVNEEGEIIEEDDASEEVEIIEEDDVNGELEADDDLDITIGATVDYEETSGPEPGYRTYDITLKAKSSKGKYYLVTMSIYYTKEKDGRFVIVDERLWGDIELGKEKQI